MVKPFEDAQKFNQAGIDTARRTTPPGVGSRSAAA